jgi:hypothetical protein
LLFGFSAKSTPKAHLITTGVSVGTPAAVAHATGGIRGPGNSAFPDFLSPLKFAIDSPWEIGYISTAPQAMCDQSSLKNRKMRIATVFTVPEQNLVNG